MQNTVTLLTPYDVHYTVDGSPGVESITPVCLGLLYGDLAVDTVKQGNRRKLRKITF